MPRLTRAAAVAVGAFVAVVAVVVGATAMASGRAPQPNVPAAAPASQTDVSQATGADAGAAGFLSQIPDTSVAASNAALQTSTGTLVARGDHVVVERLTLPAAVTVDVRGAQVSTDVVYRLTLSAGPYQMRDMPAVVSLDGRALAVGVESVDLARLYAFSFDNQVVTDGATLMLTYGLPDAAPVVWSSRIEAVS